MIKLTPDDIQTVFDACLPPNTPGDGTTVYVNKSELASISWPYLNKLLREVPTAPRPYNIKNWNCADNSRWVIAQLKILWNQENADIPVALGVIEGDVPLDGENRDIGWHSIGWAIDESRKLYLFGCYERQVMNVSALSEIKDVEFSASGG